MWYHQIHDQDFYNKEIDVYRGMGRFTLLFNSKQKGNLYEFYLFFWEKFLKKIYFEVKIDWPYMEKYIKDKEFSYFFNSEIRNLHINFNPKVTPYQEVLIPNKIYIDEEGKFFEDISIYDETTGELLWTKKWIFKIWGYSHIKQHFLIWANNLDIFAYNIYKKKYEKPAEIVFSGNYFDNEESYFIRYKDKFIYDNSNKKQDTDVLCLMYYCKSIDDFKKDFEDCTSYANLGFYFKPLNFFLNKVEKNIENKLSKYHVYIKDLIINHDNRALIKRKGVNGFLSFNTYIDIKEEVDIDELLNKLNENFKDYKVEIKQNKELDSTNIKYQIILNFNVLLFRFWENFISTSLEKGALIIQSHRNAINLSNYQNIEDNYFVINNRVYKNDEDNVLKEMEWYEFRHINFSKNSYKFYEEDNFNYTVLTNNKNSHVIIIKDWIELINDELILSLNINNPRLHSYLTFFAWRNYVAYQVETYKTGDTEYIEYLIYDFSKSTTKKIYIKNEDKKFIYGFSIGFEDFSLIQVKNDVEEKEETTIKKIKFPMKDIRINFLNQNEYVFNKKTDRKRIFTNRVFCNKYIALDTSSAIYSTFLKEINFLYTNVWLKGVYQWVPFIPVLNKSNELWIENYNNTDSERNFYCSNANSKFKTEKDKYFSLWTYLSKKRSRINNYLNTNLDNWKFWSFVFKKDFLSVED